VSGRTAYTSTLTSRQSIATFGIIKVIANGAVVREIDIDDQAGSLA
jgi:hypothetical protein